MEVDKVRRQFIENWTNEEVIQFLESNGFTDPAKLAPLRDDKINGTKLLSLCSDKKNLRSLSPSISLGVARDIIKIVDSYKPCDPKRCEVEGLVDTLTLEQATIFKIITKDEKGIIRNTFGQKVEIDVNDDEFHIAEIYDNRAGEVEASIVPLKVGPWKIEVSIGGVPIANSPFSVVVGPTPPPVNTIQKDQLEGWIEKAHGNYGKVYKGRCNNVDVAIKEMIGINKKNLEQKMGEFLAEVNILQRLHHPNIITFMGVCIESDSVNEWFIVLEWAEKASLQKVLQTEKNISLEQKFQFCIDIARGMAWLHHRTPPIVHFDLKPANILVFEDYTCKVADFGLSYLSELKESTASRGTMLYMPPETLRRKWYYKSGLTHEIPSLPTVPPDQITKIDVYAFGLIVWEICTGEEVFLEYNDIDSFCGAVCNKDVRPNTNDPKHAIPQHLSNLIHRCWAKIPATRPSFREIIPQLEQARVRTILEYPSEIDFWISYWPTQPRVPFTIFIDHLFAGNDYLKRLNKQDLALMLQTQVSGDVTQGGFKMLLNWFGPLHENNNLQQFVSVMLSKWFRPWLNADEAAGILGRDKCSGTYLVRLNQGKGSPISTSPFTISFYYGDQTRHLRVFRSHPTVTKPYGCYELECNVDSKRLSFQQDSLPDLIQTITQELPQYFSCQPLTETPVY